MPLRLAVVCEASADFRTATALVERVIVEQVDWVDEDLLSSCPLWCEFEPDRPYLLWKEIPHLASEAGIRIRGHFDGLPGEADAKAALRALRYFKLRMGSLHGVLLLRDDDRDRSRRVGLEQARTSGHGLVGQIVIGLAHCMRECWVVAGFDPADAGEIARLAEVRSELGFNPCSSPEALTAKDEAAKRSSKRVLDLLTRKDADREARCWTEAALDTLRSRGHETGLTPFLDEVRDRLIPLFDGRHPESRRP